MILAELRDGFDCYYCNSTVILFLCVVINTVRFMLFPKASE